MVGKQNIEARYGEKVKFTKGDPMQFPDFKMTFNGTRNVPVPQYTHGFFVYYDFQIVQNKESQIVSWSSGTGDIAPVSFSVGEKRFQLELGISDTKGQLQSNELVIELGANKVTK
ncbi:MAG TPA: hypothetical protein VI895_08530 [Bdellovibrionota bacterium]|nr:hypothetical protein [Bdellovibrionota bacterium]